MLSFKVRRGAPDLVSPARPTPRETEALSDIDNKRALRYYETVILFFRRCPGQSSGPDDVPAEAFRAALAQALVYYYPIAGRLREDAEGRLLVDCTAEGVVFVQADADVRLEDLGEPLLPPYPCVEELLCDAGDTRAVIGRPLLFVQFTRLNYGGFVIGFHICHNMADGFGMIQLLMTIVELACGASAPSILPVWKRDLLTSTTAPSPNNPIIYPSSSYQSLLNNTLDSTSDEDVMLATPLDEMVVDYFVFGPTEMTSLQSHINRGGYLSRSAATSYELITAVMWRCRTVALGYKSSHPVHLKMVMNARGRWNHHTPIPSGYYGNAHFCPVAELTVAELCGQSLANTVEFVRRTKLSVTKERMESMLETMASSRHKPYADPARTYEVADTKWIAPVIGSRLGSSAEFVSGGIPFAGDIASKLQMSSHMRCKNQDGEDSTVVSLLLPRWAMERFKKEMAVWLNNHDEKNLTIHSSL